METILLFAPLLGALLAGFGWRLLGETAAIWTATALLFLSCLLAWAVFLGHDGQTHKVMLFRWIHSGTFAADWAIRVDRLTAIMLVVITTVSALVHLYSVGYMAGDANWRAGEVYRPRFFAYLSFFTFAMLALVTADNLVQMFFGWEGVGVASYLLIGFYWRKSTANAAAIKAFVVNRVGDFGFALGIFALFFLVDSVEFDTIFAAAPELAQTGIAFLWTTWNAAELVAVLLFIGAMGKSAQLLLHTWLPDAMEGPTPVSALIHAATMVTAGVFLVCRMSPLYEYAPAAQGLVVAIGAATAFFAATVGLVQNDIKRVIAYSTCSQLGYMFVAAGVGVYSVAMFHLFTHAFFKALLFLGAGSVIHAMHHEQDLRRYGGLRRHIPWTFGAMLTGTLAITGVGIPLTHIGFAGFLSKDAVIESAFAAGSGFGFWALVIAAGFTAFYSWRLMFLTFWGAPRWAAAGGGHGHATEGASSHGHGDGHAGHGQAGHARHDDAGHHHGHAGHAPHESPWTMLVPLGVLALGAVLSGMIWFNVFFGKEAAVRAWFGLPAAAHAEAEGHGAGGAHGAAGGHGGAEGRAEAPAGAAPHGAEAADAAPGAQGAEAAGDAALAAAGPVPGRDVPGQGAIFIRPDNHVLHEAHAVPTWVKLAPFAAMLIGLGVAVLFYLVNPALPARLAESQRPLYLFLLNKWYFDEIYDFLLVRPARGLGALLWRRGDGSVIDGALNGVAMGVVPFLTRLAGRAQSGYLFHYAFAMVIGIALLVAWVVLRGGAG